jgi:hypothetical protein
MPSYILGWWQDTVREKCGEKEAIEYEKAVWEKGIPYWQTRTMKALNIQGNDVAACIKTLQMDPQLCFNIFDIEWEMRDQNHGTYTVRSCHAVRYFESIDDTTTLVHMCQLDWDAYRRIAQFFNPDMEVVALKLPPGRARMRFVASLSSGWNRRRQTHLSRHLGALAKRLFPLQHSTATINKE